MYVGKGGRTPLVDLRVGGKEGRTMNFCIGTVMDKTMTDGYLHPNFKNVLLLMTGWH